jgi:hypothetical protein
MMCDDHGIEASNTGTGFKSEVSGVSSSTRQIRGFCVEFRSNDRTANIKRTTCCKHMIRLLFGGVSQAVVDMKHFRASTGWRPSLRQGKEKEQESRGVRTATETHQQTSTGSNLATQ